MSKELYFAIAIIFVLTFAWGFKTFLIDKDHPLAKQIIFENSYLERRTNGEYVINFFCEKKHLRQYYIDTGQSILTSAAILQYSGHIWLDTNNILPASDDILIAFSGGAALGITWKDIVRYISLATTSRKKLAAYVAYLGGSLSGFASGAFLAKQISNIDCHEQARIFDINAAKYERDMFMTLINRQANKLYTEYEHFHSYDAEKQIAAKKIIMLARIMERQRTKESSKTPEEMLPAVIKSRDFDDVLWGKRKPSSEDFKLKQPHLYNILTEQSVRSKERISIFEWIAVGFSFSIGILLTVLGILLLFRGDNRAAGKGNPEQPI